MTDQQVVEAAYRRVFLNFEHVVVVCATQRQAKMMVDLMKEHLKNVECGGSCWSASCFRAAPTPPSKQAVCDFVTVDELRTKLMGTRPDGVYLRTEVSQEDWLDILTRCPGGVVKEDEDG